MKHFTLALIAALALFCAASATPPAASDQGLAYSYYEGSWAFMPDFASLKPIKSGTSPNIDISVRNRELNYAILWNAYISIPASGIYTFETNSDDGSMLSIAGSASPLVANDGLHAPQLRSASIFLAAGNYPITVSFFQNGGGHIMELFWSSNAGISRQRIPDQAFSSKPASSLAAGLNCSYFEGAWTSLPDFNALSPVKTSVTANIDINDRNTNDNFAFRWQGFINIKTAGSYTFETVSDDGSKLYFNTPYSPSANPLVNNDGLHPAISASGTILVNTPGWYPLTLTFFERDGGEHMQLLWTGPGISRQAVPDAALAYFRTQATFSDVSSSETGGLTGASASYYFSSTLGDDSRSAAQAQNPATPWRSVAKMNQLLATAAPGTALLLKRGDSFDGALLFGTSGTAARPIIVSAYGTGPKPVLNAFASQPAWTNTGNGIWEATLNTTLSQINMVAKGSQVQPMGRYPNITEPGLGFLSLDAHSNASSSRNSVEALYSYLGSSTQSITDHQLPAYPNWTGAELVIKKNRWTIDRAPITAHSGGTLTYLEPSGMEPIDGFGYFIQNDPRTLDQNGEWYFNGATKKIQVFSAGASPATLGIRASVIDTLVTIRSRSFITLDNISLQGANSIAIAVWDNANHVSVSSCSIDFTGNTAIKANYLSYFSLTSSVVNHTNNNGLYLAPGCWNTSITNNTIKNAGLIPGLGQSNNQTHEGIIIGGAGSVIQYNTVDSVGYVGIAITRDSVTVINNLVSNFAQITDDCGGIYTHDRGFYGRRIIGNIVLNGKGCHYGTTSTHDGEAQGIGLDDLSSFIEITGNTVANCSGKGIGLHNAQNITITNNTSFNNHTAQLEMDHDVLGPDSPTRDVVVNGNILVSRSASQPVMVIASKENDIALFGTANNNYYCRPVDDRQTFQMIPYANTPSAVIRTYDLQHWSQGYGVDNNSGRSPLRIAPYTYHSVSANLVSNGGFDQNMRHIQTPTAYHTLVQYDGYGMDGGSVKVTFTGNGSNPYQSLQYYDASTPTLQSGHTYRVRFSARAGSDNNTDFYATMLGAYGIGRTDARVFKVSNRRTEVELLFTATVNVPNPYVEIYTQHSEECPVYWIDNLEVQEVYAMSETNVDDYLRFEYNASVNARTVLLDGEYVDMKNQVYSGSIVLGAYSSAVLMRRAGAGVSQVQRVAAVPASMRAKGEEPAQGMEAGVKVSPNPATDRIEVRHGMSVGGEQAGMLTLYNVSGKVVKTLGVQMSSGAVVVGVSDLSAGVYTVKISCGSQSRAVRFVKM